MGLISPKLEAAFEAAAREPAAWTALCDTLAEAFGGIGTLILPTDRARRFPWAIGSPRLEPVLAQYIAQGWSDRDVREHSLPRGRARGYVLDSDVGAPDALEIMPYYRDLLRPHGIGGFVGVLFDVGGVEWCASVQLPLNTHAPSDEALSRVPAIAASLRGAARSVARRAAAQWDEIFTGLSHLGQGAVLFDGKGRECRRSDMATQILGRCDGVEFPGPMARQYLAKLTAHPDMRSFRPQPFVVAAVPRGSIFGSLERVPESLRLFSTEVVSLMILSQRVNVEADIASVLSTDFSLSPSEVALVLALCRGMMIKEAATQLGIAESTARQRLKSVFQKTGTRAQHQLVSKIMQVRGLLPGC